MSMVAAAPNPVPVIGGYFEPSGYYQGYSGHHYWIDYCPLCHRYYGLEYNPKGTNEGELTCRFCDSDYDGTTGADKAAGGARAWLSSANENQTHTWYHRNDNNTTVIQAPIVHKPTLKEIVISKLDIPFYNI